MSFTEKQHVQIANHPRSPQGQTEPELLCSSPPPSFFVTIFKQATISYKFILKELSSQMLSFITFKSVRKIRLFFTEALLSENGNALKGH
jgi:hypothetical protein